MIGGKPSGGHGQRNFQQLEIAWPLLAPRSPRQAQMVARSMVRNFLSRFMYHSRLMASLRVLQRSE
jgi:hypothetical protein